MWSICGLLLEIFISGVVSAKQQNGCYLRILPTEGVGSEGSVAGGPSCIRRGATAGVGYESSRDCFNKDSAEGERRFPW